MSLKKFLFGVGIAVVAGSILIFVTYFIHEYLLYDNTLNSTSIITETKKDIFIFVYVISGSIIVSVITAIIFCNNVIIRRFYLDDIHKNKMRYEHKKIILRSIIGLIVGAFIGAFLSIIFEPITGIVAVSIGAIFGSVLGICISIILSEWYSPIIIVLIIVGIVVGVVIGYALEKSIGISIGGAIGSITGGGIGGYMCKKIC